VEKFKPPIDATTFRMAAYSRNPKLIRAMIAAGADVNAIEQFKDGRQSPALHQLATTFDPTLVQLLAECGADVDARDELGRIALMIVANAASEQDRINGPDSAEKTIDMLLKLGADAKLKDADRNDALDHYRCEARRRKNQENPRIVESLQRAGANGDDATFQLHFAANITAAKQAIAAGADMNRISPHHLGITPLCRATRDGEADLVNLLLESGADVNQFDRTMTPMIHAAENGHLEIVKRLIQAGADLNTRELRDRDEDCPAMNALEAAELRDHKPVIRYLKSIGAAHEVRLLEAKVHSWDDFVEVLVKGDVVIVAAAIARQIGGKATINAYGKSFKPGKTAYVVAHPKGMAWCNVLQIAPPLHGFDDIDKLSRFCKELSKSSGFPSMWAAYGDTSAEADMLLFTPTGKSSGLPDNVNEDLTTGERLDQFAKTEKMAVAAFNLPVDPKKNIEITFAGHPAEIFLDVAFVSD
jgi:ankyrin repeat protein